MPHDRQGISVYCSLELEVTQPGKIKRHYFTLVRTSVDDTGESTETMVTAMLNRDEIQ